MVTDFAIRNEEVEVGDGATVRDVIESLALKHPRFKDYLVDSRTGQFQYGILVALNQKDVRGLKGLDTEVHEADSITFYPPISGG